MKPFMSKARKEAIKKEHADRAAARRRSGSSYANPLTDPANPGAVYYHNTTTYSGSSDYSGSDSGSGARSEYRSDPGPSSSSSYDSGSSGGGSYE